MTEPLSEANAARAEDRLSRYGVERNRWPAEDRALFDAACGDDAFAARIAAEARLDRDLARVAAPTISARFQARLLDEYRVRPRSLGFSAPRLRKAAAAAGLAAMLATGFVSGAATADGANYFELAPSPLLEIDETSAFWGGTS